MKPQYRTHIKLANMGIKAIAPHKIVADMILRKFKSAAQPVMIAVGGPGGTGKSTFAGQLALELSPSVIFALDDYKKPRVERAQKNIYGPHPDANEITMARLHIQQLKSGMTIEKPVYCREQGCIAAFQAFAPTRFVVVEGETATYADFHDLIDFSIFIDAHWKTQLNTRIRRDIEQRGYTPEKAITAFLYSNLQEFPAYGAESKNWMDVHLHCNEDYSLSFDAVCKYSAEFMELSDG